MADQKALSVSCHCGLSTYSFNVATSSLPIRQILCHCNISPRISGCLYTSYVKVPLSNPPPDLSNLTAYKSSGILTRHFCTTCSTHLYLEYNQDGHFEVSHGSIVGKTDDILDFVGHMWISDTRDGGASDWMPTFGSRKAEKWSTYSVGEPYLLKACKAASAMSPKSTSEDVESNQIEVERLKAHCHCGAISFSIARPDDESFLATSPFPDLLVPYHSGASADNPENVPWWVPNDRSRYLAGNCACDSCRRIAGFDVVQWTFIPFTGLFFGDGKKFNRPLEGGFEMLKGYRSSESRMRWFCERCGATAFYEAEERPSILDVAVGLLDAESGARAEDWLEWEIGRVSFREDAHSEQFISSLEEGLKGWREE